MGSNDMVLANLNGRVNAMKVGRNWSTVRELPQDHHNPYVEREASLRYVSNLAILPLTNAEGTHLTPTKSKHLMATYVFRYR